MSLVICTATDFESDLLRQRLATVEGVYVVTTGVGPVNAAHAATLAIVQHQPSAVLVCGIGGAYPDSGLQVGEVACASLECYGDLGASSPDGFLDMKALGFPVIASPAPIFNDLPMQIFPVERRVKFVTLSTCTGTEAAARSIALRTGGAVENMEGAAVAHVAHLHGVPVGEIRGISNMVTNRDTKSWRLKESATAAQEAAIAWIVRQ